MRRGGPKACDVVEVLAGFRKMELQSALVGGQVIWGKNGRDMLRCRKKNNACCIFVGETHYSTTMKCC